MTAIRLRVNCGSCLSLSSRESVSSNSAGMSAIMSRSTSLSFGGLVRLGPQLSRLQRYGLRLPKASNIYIGFRGSFSSGVDLMYITDEVLKCESKLASRGV